MTDHTTEQEHHGKKRDREELVKEEKEAAPYQELKWNSAPPLFLDDKFDNPTELLQKGKKTPPIHAGRTALLVVDVQPEYWSHCPAVRKDFPDFPTKLKSLVDTCRQQRAKIIWVRADYRYAHSPWLVQFARLHQGKIPAEVHSSPKDAETIQWEDFATPQGGEYVIPKTSWSSTRHTALMDLLKQSGIDTVLVCGLITSVCVQHSAFGIFEAGYRTLLVTDACADRGKARHEAALALYGDYMYELLQVQDLVQRESPFYLRPAQPVWLTKESVVQPTFFNTLQDSIVVTKEAEGVVEKQGDEDDDDSTQPPHKRQKLDGDDESTHPTFYKVPRAATTVTVATDEKQGQEGELEPTKNAMTTADSYGSLSTMTTSPNQAATEAPPGAPPGTIRVEARERRDGP